MKILFGGNHEDGILSVGITSGFDEFFNLNEMGIYAIPTAIPTQPDTTKIGIVTSEGKHRITDICSHHLNDPEFVKGTAVAISSALKGILYDGDANILFDDGAKVKPKKIITSNEIVETEIPMSYGIFVGSDGFGVIYKTVIDKMIKMTTVEGIMIYTGKESQYLRYCGEFDKNISSATGNPSRVLRAMGIITKGGQMTTDTKNTLGLNPKSVDYARSNGKCGKYIIA